MNLEPQNRKLNKNTALAVGAVIIFGTGLGLGSNITERTLTQIEQAPQVIQTEYVDRVAEKIVQVPVESPGQIQQPSGICSESISLIREAYESNLKYSTLFSEIQNIINPLYVAIAKYDHKALQESTRKIYQYNYEYSTLEGNLPTIMRRLESSLAAC